MAKEGFLLYTSFYEPIRSLTFAQKGYLLDFLFRYQIDGSEPSQTDDKDVYMAFLFFKNQFRLDEEKYHKKCEKNTESAKIRWQKDNANASERIRPNANNADKDKDKDKEKEKDNDKKKRTEFIPPQLSEVISFFVQEKYRADAGEKAWRYYNDAEWVDSKGNKVRNWKQKMRGVWFKPENAEPAKVEPKKQLSHQEIWYGKQD